MTKRYVTILLCSFTLLPLMGQGAFDAYRKQKKQQFDKYVQDKQKQLDEYRKQKNAEFAALLESKGWKYYERQKPILLPIEKDLVPEIYNENNHRHDGKEQQFEVVPYQPPVSQPQPKPIVPISENDQSVGRGNFMFYGTSMSVRWGDIKSFKIGKINEKSIAAAFRKLTSEKYNNLLSDCLTLRSTYNLCDWAYFKMLEAMSAAALGAESNEAAILHGVLFQQSGYDIRYCIDTSTGKLYLAVKINGEAIRYNYYNINGKKYFVFAQNASKQLKICSNEFSGEREMSMDITSMPKLYKKTSKNRTLKSESYNISVTSSVNENIIKFMNEYPMTLSASDPMTQWSRYANAPLSQEVVSYIYPQLKERLTNANELTAVNMLLNWVQTAFEYEIDEKVWGKERSFFAEETLYYPFSDCEDRAILFSHLVRDLVGLDVILVYYPGHVAAAVCLNEEISGDYFTLDRRKFFVADPCYIRARVGSTMPSVEGKTAKLILCKR